MQGNVFLIGFMGTGKTAIGKRVATALGKEFYDTDLEIEKITGMTIERLYHRCGPLRLESEERLVLRKMLKKENSVIALGGGMRLTPEIVNDLKKRGLTITLRAERDIIKKRVKRKDNRPLLKTGSLSEKLDHLFKEREPAYAAAHFALETSNQAITSVVNEICLNYNNYKKRRSFADKRE